MLAIQTNPNAVWLSTTPLSTVLLLQNIDPGKWLLSLNAQMTEVKLLKLKGSLKSKKAAP